MRRLFAGSLLGLSIVALAATALWAGSPHFVGDVTVKRTGNTITASGKEAGLGSETQVHIVLTLNAQCVNPGQNRPKAANKQSFTAEGDFPVQNGQANFTLSVTPVFQPDCTPPMTLVISDVKVCDVAHNVCASLSGTF